MDEFTGTRYMRNSRLSYGGHIVPGDQKSFVLPR